MSSRVLGLALVLLFSVAALTAQTPGARNGVPVLKFSDRARNSSRAWDVEYVTLTDVKEPAFRIRVHHYHGWCNGYLYITPTRIAYDPAFTPAQKDGFSVARTQLQNSAPRFAGYQFSLAGRNYQFVFLSNADGNASTPDQREDLLKFIGAAMTNFGTAQQSFFAALLGLNLPSDGTALSLTDKPIVKILDPPGVQPGATVDATGAAQSVVGVAAAAGGIRAVTVNDKPATVSALSPEIVLFQSPAFMLPPGATPLKLSVTANNNSAADTAFNAVRPDIAITQPSGKVRDPEVTLRGTIVGVHDIQKLSVAGKPVTLQKRLDGAFDFVVPNVPLQLGTNIIPGYAVQSNGERQVFDAVVERIPEQKPLSFDQISSGLKNGISVGTMVGLVQSRGVDFELTPQLEKRLRAAGANDALLDAINDAYK